MLKSGNMPPPMPPDDENDPDNPGNNDTAMDNTRNYWRDASRCPACEQSTLKVGAEDEEGVCRTMGCPLSPNNQLSPQVEDVLRRKPVQSGRKDLLPPVEEPEDEPATAGTGNRMITPRGVCHNCNQFAPIASNNLCYHCWKR
mgnify:CR=1 FL=1